MITLKSQSTLWSRFDLIACNIDKERTFLKKKIIQLITSLSFSLIENRLSTGFFVYQCCRDRGQEEVFTTSFVISYLPLHPTIQSESGLTMPCTCSRPFFKISSTFTCKKGKFFSRFLITNKIIKTHIPLTTSTTPPPPTMVCLLHLAVILTQIFCSYVLLSNCVKKSSLFSSIVRIWGLLEFFNYTKTKLRVIKRQNDIELLWFVIFALCYSTLSIACLLQNFDPWV